MMPNPDPTYIAQLMVSRIPTEIRKSISTRELNARLVEAARLTSQSRDQSLPPALQRAAGLRAKATLEAPPEAVVRQQHRNLITKAAAAPPRQAEAIRRQAAQFLEDNPIAPGTTVRKAKAETDSAPIPVFNAAGELIGICDEQDIVAVAGAGGGRDKTADDPAAAPVPASNPAAAPVTKASGKVIVFDQWKRPYVTARGNVRQHARRAGRSHMTSGSRQSRFRCADSAAPGEPRVLSGKPFSPAARCPAWPGSAAPQPQDRADG